MRHGSSGDIRFSITLTNQHPVGSDQRVGLQEQLAMLRCVRDAGWDAVFAAQHYLPGSLTHIQPLPYLARLAADAGDMRIGTGVLLLALHNPLSVAENLASLDVVCGGRLIFGVGLGYREVEYNAFGVSPREKLLRFESNLDIVRRLWAGESVSSDLPWCQLREARLTLLPVQRPSPSIWMAANSDSAVQRAARQSDAWLINPHATFATVERQVTLFHETRRRAGLFPVAGLPLAREVFCAENRKIAIQTAQPFLQSKYEAYRRWGQDRVLPETDSFDVPFSRLQTDRFILGTPDDCVEQLLPWLRLGINHFIIRTHWPGMQLEDSLRSINLFSRSVIPALRAAAQPN